MDIDCKSTPLAMNTLIALGNKEFLIINNHWNDTSPERL